MNQAIFNCILESRQLKNFGGEGKRYRQLYQHEVIFRRGNSEVWVNNDPLIRYNLPSKVSKICGTAIKDDLKISVTISKANRIQFMLMPESCAEDKDVVDINRHKESTEFISCLEILDSRRYRWKNRG